MRTLVGLIKDMSVVPFFEFFVMFYVIACYESVFIVRSIVLVNFADVYYGVPIFKSNYVLLISLQLNSNTQSVVFATF